VTTSKLPNPARPDDAPSARASRAEARVLVVDDIPETLEYLRTLIESAPEYTVAAVAGSGGEAITAAEATRPDVILMDIVMPGMDGIAAAAEIHRLPLRVPIVIMSIQDDLSYMRRAAEIGASGYLIKPFTSEALFETLSTAVRETGAWSTRFRSTSSSGPDVDRPARSMSAAGGGTPSPLASRSNRGATKRRPRPTQQVTQVRGLRTQTRVRRMPAYAANATIVVGLGLMIVGLPVGLGLIEVLWHWIVIMVTSYVLIAPILGILGDALRVFALYPANTMALVLGAVLVAKGFQWRYTSQETSEPDGYLARTTPPETLPL